MTESRKLVLKEVALVAVGEAICVAIMCVIYALLGKFSTAVLLGGLVGLLVATGNFFALAVVATLAADKAEAGDTVSGQKLRLIKFICCKQNGGLLCQISMI